MSSEAEIAYEFQGFTYRFLDDESSEIEPSKETNILPPPENEEPDLSPKDAPWSEEEIKLFREKCETYFSQIGPHRTFSNIKEMFAKISTELGTKTLKQCEQQYLDAALKIREQNRRKQRHSDLRMSHYWTEKESNFLIDRCKAYFSQADGKQILTREMWEQIAAQLGNKSSLQCKRHYYHIRKRIKARVESYQKKIPNRVKSELELIDEQQPGLSSNDCSRQETNVPFTSPTQTNHPMQNHAVWSEQETALLINRYTEYISQIGPFKKFRLKREMWRAIAVELGNKSLLQCERHYYSTIKRGNNLPEPVKESVLNHMKNKHQDHQITNKKLYEFIQTTQLTMNCSQNMTQTQVWTEEETRILFEKYKKYVCQIGTRKKFRYKKDMWKQIASEFEDDKTYRQCEQQFYRIVMKYRNKERDRIEPSEQEDEMNNTETHTNNDWLDYSSLGDSTMKSNERWMEVSKIEVEDYEISEAFRDFNNIPPANIEPEDDDQINPYSDSSSFECPEMTKVKVESIEISDDDLDDSNSMQPTKIEPQEHLNMHSLYTSALNAITTVKAESMQKKEKEKAKKTNVKSKNVSPQKWVKLDAVEYLDRPETKQMSKATYCSLTPKTQYLVWTDEEVETLFRKYKEYLPQIGPLLRFRYKKDVFKQIAAEFKNKTFQQCEQQYYRTIMRYKCNDLHTVSGASMTSPTEKDKVI